MIYTVGHEKNYDKGLRDHCQDFKKLGRRKNYPGGFACRTAEDAQRLIAEQGKTGEWAVYEVEADWLADTVPSLYGWWAVLVNDSRILRKVPQTKPTIRTEE